jgi:hypothetical protein
MNWETTTVHCCHLNVCPLAMMSVEMVSAGPLVHLHSLYFPTHTHTPPYADVSRGSNLLSCVNVNEQLMYVLTYYCE